MKKLVMVMCFALCASLAFAQTKHAPAQLGRGHEKVAVAKTSSQHDAPTTEKNYRASIFSTKAGGDVIASWDFSADNEGYTTGTIGANQTILESDGSSVDMIQHTQVISAAEWQRIPDTTYATALSYYQMTTEQGGYPRFAGYFMSYDSPSADNGFMVMIMGEAYWGSPGTVANFDAYFALDPISTSGTTAVLLNFYQWHRIFNYDKCYVDYSTDGSTWYQYEINVAGVDGNVNDDIDGERSVMLPAACGNAANLHLRLRWTSDNNAGGAYGYWWFIDDLSVVAANDNELTLLNSAYYGGLYHQVPQGLDVPITWWASLQNTGTGNQPNAAIALSHLNASQSGISTIAELNVGTIASAEQVDTAIIGVPYMVYNGWLYLRGADELRNSTDAVFPTDNTGDNYIVASYKSDNYPQTYQDTILYMVNALETSPDGVGQVAVWAMDNGILTPNAYQIDGMVGYENEVTGETDWYLSDGLGDDQPSYAKIGYRLWNTFTTGAEIPENWVLRGMQLVAATQYDPDDASQTVNVAQGAQIIPEIWMDSVEDYFSRYIETGAGVYETRVEDFNYYQGENLDRVTRETAGDNYKEYMLPGEYNVINIMFPEQPELEANTPYRVGYRLVQGSFAVAGQSYGYYHYDDIDDTTYFVRFSRQTLLDGSANEMTKYGKTFFPGHNQNFYQYDPDRGGVGRATSSLPPMIRLLVGPRVEYPTFNVSVECEGYEGLDLSELEGTGVFYDDEDVCGQTVEMTQGSAGAYLEGDAEEGYVVYQILVNGTVVYTIGEEPTDENVQFPSTAPETGDIVYYDLSGNSADVTVKYIFADSASVAPDSYTVTLTANPAEGGTVSIDDGAASNEVTGTFEPNTQILIIATANDGWEFTGWSDGDNNDVRTITVNRTYNLTANFVQEGVESYTITVSSNNDAWGTATVNGQTSTTVAAGTDVIVAATPATGYHFVSWSDNGDQTHTVTVNNNMNLTATFAADDQPAETYTITVSSNNNTWGTATVNGQASATVEAGTEVFVSATANDGYHFVSWSDGGDQTHQVTVNSDMNLVATFEENSVDDTYYTVTVNEGEGGHAYGGGQVREGSTTTVIAAPDACYDFANWTVNGTVVSTETNYTFTVTENITLTANFTIKTYTITVNSNNTAWGTAVATPNPVNCGSDVTLTATANTGYEFERWSDGVTTNPRTIVNVTAPASYTATFKASTPTSGINETTSNVSMSLYPNPANGKVNIAIEGVNGNVNCAVLDMSGRTVYTQTINAEETTSINISNLAKGAYFVRITNNEFTKVEKLVVR